MTIEEAIKELKDASDSEVRYGDTKNHYDKVMKRVEALDLAIKALEQQPCEDCISREEALKAFAEKCGGECACCMYNGSGYDSAENCKLIKSMTSITPTRPKGKWIEKAEDYYKAINEYGGGVNEDTPYFVDDIACPKCLKLFSVIDNETERFDFCPNCGAEMEKENE